VKQHAAWDAGVLLLNTFSSPSRNEALDVKQQAIWGGGSFFSFFDYPLLENETLEVKQQAVWGAGVLILNISGIMDIIYCFLSRPHEAFQGGERVPPIELIYTQSIYEWLLPVLLR
jgi:hypothetical protein